MHALCVQGLQADIQLPNELLLAIIHDLASDTTETKGRTRAALASCRLASRAFYSLTTPLFFSSIELTQSLDDWASLHTTRTAFAARADKLNQLLSIHDVVSSVHTFTLRCGETVLVDPTIGVLVSTILHRLAHSIRTFTFDASWDGFRRFQFPSISTDLLSAIQGLCKSPSLTTLHLLDIASFPIKAITASPSLRCLHLREISKPNFDDLDSMGEISSLQSFYLDFLEIDRKSLDFLVSGISCNKSIAKHFSQIRNLRLNGLFYKFSRMSSGWNTIFQLVSQSLTTLDLPTDHLVSRTDLEYLLEHLPFDLGQLPALRHFKVQLPICSPNNLSVLSFLDHLLSFSSAPSDIQTLEIEITWHDVDDEHELKNLFSCENAEWSRLDEVLTTEMFVSLRKVVLRLNLWMTQLRGNLEYTLALSYIDLLFPKFRAFTSNQRTLETYIKLSQYLPTPLRS